MISLCYFWPACVTLSVLMQQRPRNRSSCLDANRFKLVDVALARLLSLGYHNKQC